MFGVACCLWRLSQKLYGSNKHLGYRHARSIILSTPNKFKQNKNKNKNEINTISKFVEVKVGRKNSLSVLIHKSYIYGRCKVYNNIRYAVVRRLLFLIGTLDFIGTRFNEDQRANIIKTNP